MQRRDFMAAGAAAIADPRLRIADSSPPNPQSTIRNPQSAQEPSLSPEVFARRLDRARGELKARGLDLLIATPSTSYEYLTGYNPGRSERLIALLLPVVGAGRGRHHPAQVFHGVPRVLPFGACPAGLRVRGRRGRDGSTGRQQVAR